MWLPSQLQLQLLASSALLVNTALGYPEASRVRRDQLLKRSADSFLATEKPIALQNLLCNIGASGCRASGASAGIVVASPDKSNPDCKMHRHVPSPSRSGR